MKTKSIFFIIIVVFIIGGFVIFISGNRSKTQTNKSVTSATQTQTEEEKAGVFESIRDAMTKSLSIKCEYNNEKTKTVAYIKGTSIRVDGFLAGKSNTGAIIRDNRLWSWDIDKKEGIIMPLDMSKSQGLSQEEIINNLEKEKQFCHVTVVADSVFNPPADVKFQDLGKLFEKISGTTR